MGNPRIIVHVTVFSLGKRTLETIRHALIRTERVDLEGDENEHLSVLLFHFSGALGINCNCTL